MTLEFTLMGSCPRGAKSRRRLNHHCLYIAIHCHLAGEFGNPVDKDGRGAVGGDAGIDRVQRTHPDSGYRTRKGSAGMADQPGRLRLRMRPWWWQALKPTWMGRRSKCRKPRCAGLSLRLLPDGNQLPAINNLGTSALYLTADGQESNHVQLVIEP